MRNLHWLQISIMDNQIAAAAAASASGPAQTIGGHRSARTGPAPKRIYTRDELFRLASLMDGYHLVADTLERHRNHIYESLDGEGSSADDEQLNGPRSIASFGRKKSDLLFGKQQQQQNFELGAAQFSSEKKFYRMSSSPTIKYNRMPVVAAELAPASNLPSHLRAEYARLTSRSPNSRASQLTGAERAPGSALRHSQRAESGGGLLGLTRGRSMDDRKASDEPMSLPYSINTRPAEPERRRKRGSLLDEPADDSSGRFNFAMENEDDDFDISSLLSITVLSDIRFIRQESSRAHSPAPAARSQRPINNGVQRTRSHEMAVRMPPRSRTSLDFHLSETRRRSHLMGANSAGGGNNIGGQTAAAGGLHGPRQATGLRHHANQPQLAAQSAPSEQYNSLDETVSLPFNWQVNPTSSGLFVDPKTALEYHLKCAKNNNKNSAGSRTTSSGAAGTKSTASNSEEDLIRAKIIETFKAQVLARANEQDSVEDKRAAAAAGTSSKGPSGAGETKKVAEATLDERAALGRAGNDKDNKDGDGKPQVGGQVSQAGGASSTAKPIIGSSTDDESPGSKVGAKETASGTVDSAQPAKQNESAGLQVSALNIQASAKVTESKITTAGKVPSRASNIPRLISLQRGDSQQTRGAATACHSLSAAGATNSPTQAKPMGAE
jgi:hypothetical protein